MIQLYTVFYDEKHYASIMGSGKAIQYVQSTQEKLKRNFVVSVAPNSMKPKDELSEQNLAMQRWESKAIDPIGLMKAINSPDPLKDAEALVLWTTNPQGYMATYFPQAQPNPMDSTDPNITGGQPPPEQGQPPPDLGLSSEPANSQLSNVKLPPIN